MMTEKPIIYIKNDQETKYFSFAMRRLIKEAVAATLFYEEFEGLAEVSVMITDDEGIHALNKQYRHVDRPTDVLSFPTEEEEDAEGDIVPLGDVVIDLERAYAQAAEYGHTPEREVAFLTVHSMLHLLGYDHETSAADEKEMFRIQEEILQMIGQVRD